VSEPVFLDREQKFACDFSNRILRDQASIVALMTALMDLYSGRPDSYIRCLANMAQEVDAVPLITTLKKQS
jgi:hypothetical protein